MCILLSHPIPPNMIESVVSVFNIGCPGWSYLNTDTPYSSYFNVLEIGWNIYANIQMRKE